MKTYVEHIKKMRDGVDVTSIEKRFIKYFHTDDIFIDFDFINYGDCLFYCNKSFFGKRKIILNYMKKDNDLYIQRKLIDELLKQKDIDDFFIKILIGGYITKYFNISDVYIKFTNS